MACSAVLTCCSGECSRSGRRLPCTPARARRQDRCARQQPLTNLPGNSETQPKAVFWRASFLQTIRRCTRMVNLTCRRAPVHWTRSPGTRRPYSYRGPGWRQAGRHSRSRTAERPPRSRGCTPARGGGTSWQIHHSVARLTTLHWQARVVRTAGSPSEQSSVGSSQHSLFTTLVRAD